MSAPKVSRHKAHISQNSVFYNKIVPVLLGGMALLTVIFIIIAAGILLGFVPFR